MGGKLSTHNKHKDIIKVIDTKDERVHDLLYHGYIRQNNCTLYIPYEIYQLIKQWFSPSSSVITWTISYSQLLNVSTDKPEPRCFTINNISFSFYLSKNPRLPSQRNIGIEPFSAMPCVNTQIMTFYNKITCYELNQEWKCQHSFVRKKHNICSRLCKDKHDGFHIMIDIDNIPKYKHFTFAMEMELLRIQCSKSKCETHYVHRHIRCDDKVQFEWNIDTKLRNQFMNTWMGRIFWSKLFGIDDNFGLMCVPKNQKNKCIVQLISMHLPYNSSCVRANVCFQLKKNGKCIVSKVICDRILSELQYDNCGICVEMKALKFKQSMKESQSFSVNVKIHFS